MNESEIRDPREIDRYDRLVPEWLLGAMAEFPEGGVLAETIRSVYWQRYQERLVRFLEYLRESSVLSFDKIAELIEIQPRLADLLFEAMTIAARTRLENKRRALGKAVASGLLAADDAVVDEIEMPMRTLDILEAPHIKVFDILQRVEGLKDRRGREQVPGPLEKEQLLERLPDSREVVDPILKAVEGAALIINAAGTTYGGLQGKEAWVLARYGRKLLEFLSERGDSNLKSRRRREERKVRGRRAVQSSA